MFDIQGRIHVKNETRQISDTFSVRDFVIEENSGNYTQYISFQLTQDRVSLLDSFNEGDEVKVSFYMRGRKYERDGNTRYFNSLDAMRIENIGQAGGVSQETEKSDFPKVDAGEEKDDDLPF